MRRSFRVVPGLALLGALGAMVATTSAQEVFHEEVTILPDTPGFGGVGQAVALDGSRLLVGGFESYIFEDGSRGWVQQQELISPVTGACGFGRSVALDGARAAVGDPFKDFGGFCAGEGAVASSSCRRCPAGRARGC